MPWGVRTENPLAAEIPDSPASKTSLNITSTESLLIAIEGVIHPFGYKSISELASISIHEASQKVTLSADEFYNTSMCSRCKSYEALIRGIANVLLLHSNESQLKASHTADSGTRAASNETNRGVVEVLDCSPLESSHGSQVVVNALESVGCPPQSTPPVFFATFQSVTSAGSSQLTSIAEGHDVSTSSWLQDFLGPHTPKKETVSYRRGIDEICQTRSVLLSSTSMGQKSYSRMNVTNGGGVVGGGGGGGGDSCTQPWRRVTTYIPQGASYSISTFPSIDLAPAPLVKETGRTIIGRKDDKQMINDYVVLRSIGRGSHGRVVLVQHRESKELFAMKILQVGRVLNQRRVKAIRSEIAVMKAVAHPNLVRLHEVIGDKERNTVFLILQYISGGTIARELTPTTIEPIPETQLRRYTLQIISALKCLHSHGIFHRDIKPDNILVDGDGNVFLGDFGVSAMCTDTGVRGVEGTPAFMAPEVCSGKREVVGELVDVWALGVTLYQLMYGILPFRAATYFGMTRAIVNNPITFPDDVEWRERRRVAASTATKQLNVGDLEDICEHTGKRWEKSVTVKKNDKNESEGDSQGRNEEYGYEEEEEDEDDDILQCNIQSSPEFKEMIIGVLCKEPAQRWTLRRMSNSLWLNNALDTEGKKSVSQEIKNDNQYLPSISITGRRINIWHDKNNAQTQEPSSKYQNLVRVQPILYPSQCSNNNNNMSNDNKINISNNNNNNNNARHGNVRYIGEIIEEPLRQFTKHEVQPATRQKSWRRLFPSSWRKGGKSGQK